MIFKHLDIVLYVVIVIVAIEWAISAYAYLVNLHRPADDPQKKEYHPSSVLLGPLAIPVIIGGGVLLFFVTALLYAGIFIVFPILLIALRKPFLFVWLHKIATKIGDPLLKVNHSLTRMIFHP